MQRHDVNATLIRRYLGVHIHAGMAFDATVEWTYMYLHALMFLKYACASYFD